MSTVELLNVLKRMMRELIGATKANRAYKAEVDLSVARDNASLIEEWNLRGKEPFLSLSILRAGTGIYTIRTYFTDTNYIEYTRDELDRISIIDRQMIDVRMTNPAQTNVVNPCFVIDWRE